MPPTQRRHGQKIVWDAPGGPALSAAPGQPASLGGGGGAVETQARRDVEVMIRDGGPLVGFQPTIAEAIYAAARKVDEGDQVAPTLGQLSKAMETLKKWRAEKKGTRRDDVAAAEY